MRQPKRISSKILHPSTLLTDKSMSTPQKPIQKSIFTDITQLACIKLQDSFRLVSFGPSNIPRYNDCHRFVILLIYRRWGVVILTESVVDVLVYIVQSVCAGFRQMWNWKQTFLVGQLETEILTFIIWRSSSSQTSVIWQSSSSQTPSQTSSGRYSV